MSAVSPPSLGVAWVTATTPGSLAMALPRSVTVPFGSVLVITSAVTESGALYPSLNAAVILS